MRHVPIWILLPALGIIAVSLASSRGKNDNVAGRPAAPAVAAPTENTTPGPYAYANAPQPAPGERQPLRTPGYREVAPAPNARAPITYVTIPSGRRGPARLATTLSTERNQEGDTFIARLASSWRVRGVTVLPRGTRVMGHLSQVESTGRGKHKAEMVLRFDRLGLPDGRTVPIAARPVAYKAGGESKRDVALIGGGTVIGGVIGHLTGSMAKGAVIGAAAGTGAALAARGKPIVLGAGHPVMLVLRGPVRVPVRTQTAQQRAPQRA